MAMITSTSGAHHPVFAASRPVAALSVREEHLKLIPERSLYMYKHVVGPRGAREGSVGTLQACSCMRSFTPSHQLHM